MIFLVDAQLPPAMARWLSAKGYEAFHVSDFGMQTATDREIWEFAAVKGAVIITKDEDFATRRVLSAKGPVIVRVRLGNTRNSVLIAWLERGLPLMIDAIERGEVLIELA
jgi:predicted nuclease of predicted toxin-antitoxin system